MKTPLLIAHADAIAVGVALLSATLSTCALAKDDCIELRGIPAPAKGEFGKLGFQIQAPWMDGWLDMRFPETLHSSLGLHFIDHSRRDMPPRSHQARGRSRLARQDLPHGQRPKGAAGPLQRRQRRLAVP